MKKMLIFGLGEQAELAHYYFKNHTSIDVAGFTVDSDYITQDTFCGLPVYAFEDKNIVNPTAYDMFIATGYKRMNDLRTEKYQEAKARGFAFPSYIDKRAVIADNVTIGDNCFILEMNNIQPFVKIGNNVTVWSGNHIGHHSSIDDNCFIASHVVVSGGVEIGKNVFIGVNATIFDHIKISEYTFIGGNSLVQKNTKPGQVYIEERTKPHTLKSHDIL